MKELLEKLSAIREDLLAFKAQVPDDARFVVEHGKYLPFQKNPHIHKLADLARQKGPTMVRSYDELCPYMTADQWSRACLALGFDGAAEIYLRTGKDHLTGVVTRLIPLVIADLEDFTENLNKGYSGTAKT